MKFFFHIKAKGVMLFCLLFFVPMTLSAQNFVSNEDKILDDRVVHKIEQMGEELFQKSGIAVYLIVKKNGNGENIIAYEKAFAEKLSTPFALLTLFVEDQKVDIYHSPELGKEFDKEKILSPLPWRGSIIPLLTGKKQEANVSAALLNGYADIVEQIANFRKIELQSAIGSANKNIIGSLRIFIYGFLVIMVMLIVRKRMKKSVKSKE